MGRGRGPRRLARRTRRSVPRAERIDHQHGARIGRDRNAVAGEQPPGSPAECTHPPRIRDQAAEEPPAPRRCASAIRALASRGPSRPPSPPTRGAPRSHPGGSRTARQAHIPRPGARALHDRSRRPPGSSGAARPRRRRAIARATATGIAARHGAATMCDEPPVARPPGLPGTRVGFRLGKVGNEHRLERERRRVHGGREAMRRPRGAEEVTNTVRAGAPARRNSRARTLLPPPAGAERSSRLIQSTSSPLSSASASERSSGVGHRPSPHHGSCSRILAARSAGSIILLTREDRCT